ncbi:hypothetical protein H1S01_17275 [Heliobacterium chlorum]|uniref:Uncharacterized protein n=1 Tax=Heliobacterium chlorum TaxID=2698 RepID=A0ABR7T7X9_HELCL|nr:hypothetical protein [Heliobacterium chlorum]MBC9786217.1 hypothetical protein [Heliobacterium chlorum]
MRTIIRKTLTCSRKGCSPQEDSVISFRVLADIGEELKRNLLQPMPDKVTNLILPLEKWTTKCIKSIRRMLPKSATLEAFVRIANNKEEPTIIRLEKLLFIVQGLAITEELLEFVKDNDNEWEKC